MTAPADNAADLAAAQLAIHAAVRELTQPGTEDLDRSDPDLDDQHGDADYDRRALAAASRRRREAGQLADPAMRRRAREAVNRTVATISARAERRRRAQHTRTAPIPSLLDQLAAAVHHTGGTNGVRGAGNQRAAIGLAAAELLAHIDRHIRRGTTGTTPAAPRPYATPADRAADLHHWASLAGHWRTDRPNYLLAAASAAQQWTEKAPAILTPSRSFGLAAACPACGRRIAHVRDDTGETVRKRALQVDETGARCLAERCGATWEPGRFELLARVLEEQGRATRH